MYIFQSKTHKLTEGEKVSIIKSRLHREDFQLIQTFMNSEKKACKTVEGLFSTLGEKYKANHKETILSLLYCRLKRKSQESAEEWMGRFSIKTKDYKEKEYNRRLVMKS